MSLVKIADLYPNYKRDIFNNNDIINFPVYDYSDEKIGSVHDIIVDETGRFRYLVIDTGFWIFGKKVLLPIGRASVSYSQERIYAKGLTKEQAEDLPEYDEDMTIDRDYEERVRMVYRGVENESDPSLYSHQETDDNQSLKLYEERLVASKERFRAGAVTIGKRVETETANVSVPVEKEKVVIERSKVTNTNAVEPGEAAFQDGEIAKVEVYEESADIEKQAFVREEVTVRKQVDRDIVSAQDTLRREELEVETEGEGLVSKDL